MVSDGIVDMIDWLRGEGAGEGMRKCFDIHDMSNSQ